jgi:hypothetical protein
MKHVLMQQNRDPRTAQSPLQRVIDSQPAKTEAAHSGRPVNLTAEWLATVLGEEQPQAWVPQMIAGIEAAGSDEARKQVKAEIKRFSAKDFQSSLDWGYRRKCGTLLRQVTSAIWFADWHPKSGVNLNKLAADAEKAMDDKGIAANGRAKLSDEERERQRQQRGAVDLIAQTIADAGGDVSAATPENIGRTKAKMELEAVGRNAEATAAEYMQAYGPVRGLELVEALAVALADVAQKARDEMSKRQPAQAQA